MSNLINPKAYTTTTIACIISAVRASLAEAAVRDWLGGPGPLPPVAKTDAPAHSKSMKHTVLSFAERIEIQAALRAGQTQQSIALRLGRSASALCMELKRNGGQQNYFDVRAFQAAHKRRARARRGYWAIAQTSPLRDAIHTHLKRGWSPEEIAGMLNMITLNKRICAPPTNRSIAMSMWSPAVSCDGSRRPHPATLEKTRRRTHRGRNRKMARV